MKADKFLNFVVRKNLDELIANPDDLRLAVNSIQSLDSFFGILAAQRNDEGTSNETDEIYRKRIAVDHAGYRLLRDTAFSIKHGRLGTAKIPRLVDSADAVQQDVPRWSDNSSWNDDAVWDEAPAVFIEFELDGREDRITASATAISVFELAASELAGKGWKKVEVADLLQQRGVLG